MTGPARQETPGRQSSSESAVSRERFVNGWASFHQLHSWWQFLHFIRQASCVADMLRPGGEPGDETPPLSLGVGACGLYPSTLCTAVPFSQEEKGPSIREEPAGPGWGTGGSEASSVATFPSAACL